MRSRTSSASSSTSRFGAICLAIRSSGHEVLQVGAHGGVDAGVLDLHRDLAAVVERRAVDLPDRRGGDRLLVERREHAVQRLAVARARAPCASRRTRPSAPSRAARRASPAPRRGRPAAPRRGPRPRASARPSSRRPSSTRGRARSAARPRPAGGPSASAASSGVRPRFAADVAAYFAASVAASRPSVAVRRRRPPRTSPLGGRVGTGVLRLLVAGGHGAPVSPGWTCEPGTMSSRPSGQRTQALCPPS